MRLAEQRAQTSSGAAEAARREAALMAEVEELQAHILERRANGGGSVSESSRKIAALQKEYADFRTTSHHEREKMYTVYVSLASWGCMSSTSSILSILERLQEPEGSRLDSGASAKLITYKNVSGRFEWNWYGTTDRQYCAGFLPKRDVVLRRSSA